MKHRFVRAVAVLVFLLVAVTVGAIPVTAQQPNPTPDISDLEDRIKQLEERHDETIDSLKQTNEQYRNVLFIVGAIVAMLGAVQGSITVVQVRREGQREARQATRERVWDKADLASVEKVSQVMELVHRTLKSRLDAEEAERKRAEKAREELREVRVDIETVNKFLKDYQTMISDMRQVIEERASRWARTVSRHNFRGMAVAFQDWVQRYDVFVERYEKLEKETRRFTARVPYIRGIAAHYANQPAVAKKYLEEVIRAKAPEQDEDKTGYQRRVANAYYYLGLIESNLGQHREAVRLFKEANLALNPEDFLTRVVTAEAYVMLNEFTEARELAGQIRERARLMKAQSRLRNFHLRLFSRSRLIEANRKILERGDDWLEDARELLEEVFMDEPQYYYATVTLAQVYHAQGNHDRAEELFKQAYEDINGSNHLSTVTETRSRILVLMAAGMCRKHGFKDEQRKQRADEHLVKADELLDNLPRASEQDHCTVFSILSKRNEDRETIRRHIEMIRESDVLLV